MMKKITVYSEIPYNEFIVIKRLAEAVYNQSISEYIKDCLESRIEADLDDYITIGQSFKETAERLIMMVNQENEGRNNNQAIKNPK